MQHRKITCQLFHHHNNNGLVLIIIILLIENWVVTHEKTTNDDHHKVLETPGEMDLIQQQQRLLPTTFLIELRTMNSPTN